MIVASGFKKYPKVLSSDILSRDIPITGDIYVEEKYDGSQFRFMQHADGTREFGSKNVVFQPGVPEKSFTAAVDSANAALDRFAAAGVSGVDAYFVAEYLRSPKHNTLAYSRVPRGNLVLFEAEIGGVPVDVVEVAEVMQLEPVRVIEVRKTFPSLSEVDAYFNEESSLGGTRIEGVVCKAYDTYITVDGVPRRLMLKYVQSGFKELNARQWHQGESPVDFVSSLFNYDAIYTKALGHLRDNGSYTGTLRDIKPLIDLVEADLDEEYAEAIKEMLYQRFKHDIQRRLIRGIPQFYKAYLAENTLQP